MLDWPAFRVGDRCPGIHKHRESMIFETNCSPELIGPVSIFFRDSQLHPPIRNIASQVRCEPQIGIDARIGVCIAMAIDNWNAIGQQPGASISSKTDSAWDSAEPCDRGARKAVGEQNDSVELSASQLADQSSP
jgi:hypothetical protein